MIWKSLIAPLILLISVGVLIFLSKRDYEDILIQKKQKENDGCPKCISSKQSVSTKKYKSVEYIPVQDIEDTHSPEDSSESDHT